MKTINTVIFLILIFTTSCKPNTKKAPTTHNTEVQGHRGDRGNLPENTIEAFLSALHKGVDVLELDIVISKDKKVVVSHEPYMSALYMTKPSGAPVLEIEEEDFNLYKMNYDSIKTFDSGSRGNTKFPSQQKLKTYKPLLSEVFKVIEKEIREKKLPAIKYNIEIKSHKSDYEIYQPQPEIMVDLVMQVIKEHKMENKINIQSFDPTPLNILHKKHPDIEIAFLVSKGSMTDNLKLLNFHPQIYSPFFRLIQDKSIVDSLKNIDIKVIPWTVNNEKDIKLMLDLQVDAIITDYPERVLELKK